MNEQAEERPRSLLKELVRHEATGELPLGPGLEQALMTVDRYLQAIAHVQRLRPDTGTRE